MVRSNLISKASECLYALCQWFLWVSDDDITLIPNLLDFHSKCGKSTCPGPYQSSLYTTVSIEHHYGIYTQQHLIFTLQCQFCAVDIFLANIAILNSC